MNNATPDRPAESKASWVTPEGTSLIESKPFHVTLTDISRVWPVRRWRSIQTQAALTSRSCQGTICSGPAAISQLSEFGRDPRFERVGISRPSLNHAKGRLLSSLDRA